MAEYGFSLTRIFTYKDRIYDSVLILENTGQKNAYLDVFHTAIIILYASQIYEKQVYLLRYIFTTVA